jgi:hypothetical protein
MPETAAGERQIVVTRRSVLRLLGGLVLGCLSGLGDECGAAALARVGVAGSRSTPSPLHERLAALGERLDTADPAAAARLAAFVDTEARRAGLPAGRLDTADRVCSALLDESRVRAEFRHGHLQQIDGWILARSEAAVCIHLHRLIRSSAALA